MTSSPPTWHTMDLTKHSPNDPSGYSLCPPEYSLYLDKDNDPEAKRPQSPGSSWSRDIVSSSSGRSTKMNPPVPFEVPQVWQTAMLMVSVNAGLFPHEILTQYHRQQPVQKLKRPGYTELDMTGSKRASNRGIKAVTIRYADNDPGNIYLMVIFVDEIDPNTKRNIVRLITNTSIKHVLEAEPGANCPLWLPVHSDVTHAFSPYQIIPCCEHWIEDLNFKRPISNEEKQVPAVVERLFQEIRRKDLLLAAKDREVQDRDDELARLRDHHARFDETDAMAVPELVPQQSVFDMNAITQQYWLVGVTVVVTLITLFSLR